MPGCGIGDDQKLLRRDGNEVVAVPVQQDTTDIENESLEIRYHFGVVSWQYELGMARCAIFVLEVSVLSIADALIATTS